MISLKSMAANALATAPFAILAIILLAGRSMKVATQYGEHRKSSPDVLLNLVETNLAEIGFRLDNL
jgi:hypothetical protein